MMNFLIMLVALLALIYMFDVVELLRRAAKVDDVTLGTVFTLGLLKLPEVGQQLFTFAVLFSAIFTFWTLTKRYELMILRTAGLSVWQFIIPILFAAFLIGLVKIMMINPLSVMLLSRYETLEREFLEENKNPISLSDQGLWLRQDYNKGSAIIHAQDIKVPEWLMRNMSVFILDQNDNFVKRIDAGQAKLIQDNWQFRDVVLNAPGSAPEKLSKVLLLGL